MIEVSVCTSDVYGIHVCAEKIIGVRLSHKELVEYVKKNNKDNKYIRVLDIFKEHGTYLIEWDDYCIDPNCIKGREQEGMKYYVIQYNTPYESLLYSIDIGKN